MTPNYTEVTTSRPLKNADLASEGLLVTAFTLILSIGVIGNLFVIYVFGRKLKSNHRSTTELLILYLGITDLLSSILNPSLFIYWTLTNYSRWDFGNFGCHVFPTVGPIMTSISSGLLITFAIDRYIAIVTPFRGTLSRKTVSIAFIINILISTCFYFPYIIALKFDPTLKICKIPYPSEYSYGVPNCIFIILRLCLFATVFSFTNIKIFKTLRKRNTSFKRMEDRVERLKQSKKIMSVLFTMEVVFTLLVFPRELFYLGYNLFILSTKSKMYSNPTLTQINSWLKVAHTANSCANIFIYSNMHTVYRKQIIRTFLYFGKFKRSRKLSYPTTSYSSEKRSSIMKQLSLKIK
ncbi:melanopsin isoform X1 [Hydra vulgaris]|uniref:melanopsin isoform X1 n=1 Tax=Hydra vulgaris TaxID=6087 RepID=UPI001F5E6191|nr:melanopsin-like [Hydra vulgaris]